MREKTRWRRTVPRLRRLIQTQMLQYFLDNVWVFNARYDLYIATAFLTRFYFNGEDPLQSLRPSERGPVSNSFCPCRIVGPAPILQRNAARTLKLEDRRYRRPLLTEGYHQ
jgi:hypothetical protein